MDGHLPTAATGSWAALEASGPFDVVVADPPWNHWGSPDKWAAAGKFYDLMTDGELAALPVRRILARKAVVFMWCTSSSLARAVDLLRVWGLHYRGVAFVWCKTSQSGRPIGAQGVRPSITKPLTEFVIAGSTQPRGRPLPLASEAIKQTVFAPRGRHSEKPDDVQDAIDQMYPGLSKAELFARRCRKGWICWGNEAPDLTSAAAAEQSESRL
ncbi:MT-A70 family methyltransferase [Roseicella sp. DB1501]|uniref:MT-A70 family methyltransferase n=1 Tax=Roseicella sp. DB1501 TaxID=2730925 RepID=UPI00349FD840